MDSLASLHVVNIACDEIIFAGEKFPEIPDYVVQTLFKDFSV